MRAAVLALIAGCGRFGFADVVDARAGDTLANPDAMAADFLVAMPCETDIVLGPVPQSVDQIVWADFGAQQLVVSIYHLDASHHEIHVRALSVAAGHIVVGPDVTTFAAPDLTSLVVQRVPAGPVLLVHDVQAVAMRVLALDATFKPTSNVMFPSLQGSFVPFARAGTTNMIVGDTGAIVAYTVDDSLAVTGGPFTIDSSADSPTHASIGAFGNDFIVGWTSLATGKCNFVRVSAAGTVLSAAIDIGAPLTACSYDTAIGITGGIAYTVVDENVPLAYGGAIDSAFTMATTPKPIGANDSWPETLLPDNTRALVAVRTTGDSRIATIGPTGDTMMLGSDFGLGGSDSDNETIAALSGAFIHVRSEAGTMSARKLCR